MRAKETEIPEKAPESPSGLFEKGMAHMKKGEALKALSCFEKSHKIMQTPECQSYLGLVVALERGKFNEGIALCEEAVSKGPEDPQLYLNLGKVLYKSGRKKEAIDAVRKGLSYGRHDESVRWLEGLGIRRKPIIPFLPRGHFINKYLGRFLSSLGVFGPSFHGNRRQGE